MIDDKKDLKFNKSSEEELELNYEDTSSVKDADNNEVNTGSHQDFFEPLNEETYVEDTETKEDKESEDSLKVEEDTTVEENEKVEESSTTEETLEEEMEELVEAEKVEEEEVEQTETAESEEEVVEDEEISEESEDEVVEVNDEFPSSASGLETDMTPTSDESVEPPSLDIEDGYEVDTELDEYGNVIEVFAGKSRNVSTFALNDIRLPTGVKGPAGTVAHFGETKGGVAFSIVGANKSVESGKYKFQGTARPSLVFTGGILDAKATVSLVSTFDGGNIELRTSPATSVVTNTLRQFLINAANERIDEINGVKYSDSERVKSIDDRTYLTLALSYILYANNGSTGGSTVDPLRLTFRDLDSLIPKQTTIDFVASTIFTTDLELIKNIVNEDSFVSNQSNSPKNSRNVSNVNLNAEGIAVNIDFKAENPENGLKTNTRYEFIAPNKDLVFFPVADSSTKTGSAISYVEGLTMTQFKTGKQLPLFETYSVASSVDLPTSLAMSAMISLEEITSAVSMVSSIDFLSIDDSTFVDYNNMVSTASNISLDVRGTSIKFKTLKIFDKDSTITKMEIEDDRMNRYPVSLAPIDSNNVDSGAYPQVTGLQRATPYIFRKFHITAQPESESITKTLQLSMLSYGSNGSTTTALTHNISIRTSTFTEPTLKLSADKLYVKNDGSTSSVYDSSNYKFGPVFVPRLEVELPNKIKLPVVTNDKDALRYVIEVETTDVTVKDLILNGLKGNEQYKVEKIDGKDKVYFIVTLYNLSENRDYGFLILELSYTDIDGKELITRQVISGINVITNIPLNGGEIRQYPDQTLDNTTGPELTNNAVFNVTLFEAKTLEARKAEIPVFIDDMNGRFLRMEFKKPEGNPAVEVELEGSILRFTNLEPKSEVVYKLDFIWKDKDNKEQTLSKYAKISTPAVPAVDVKGTTITTTSSTAEIVFELFSAPKSTISGVTLSDEKIKFTWNRDKLTLNLEGLKPNTEYKDLEITFKLENGLITKYKIETFKTKEEVKPPTGNVADFVARIYEAALGRKPEVEGWRFWVQKLESKELSVTQFVYDLMAQDEFVNRFLSKEDFIKMMYIIVVGREPEEEGQKYWERKYDEYKLQESSLAEVRRRIATEMMSEPEFKDYVTKIGLKY